MVKPYYSDEQSGIQIFCGDNLSIFPQLSGIDTILTDAPYGFAFMGKQFDTFKSPQHFQEWCKEWSALALAACKPGAMMLVFGGPRTVHRLTCGIEDAGWQIRDCLMWLYGQGFCKSWNFKEGPFKGYGTGLSPAWEPIVLAMKPLEGTFAQNAERHGVSGLAIDKCRIHAKDSKGGEYKVKRFAPGASVNKHGKWKQEKEFIGNQQAGRWPKNLILDEESAEMLDRESGELVSGGGIKNPVGGAVTWKKSSNHIDSGYQEPSTGGASRFFYIAKSSNSDRGNQDAIDMPLFNMTDPGVKNVHPTCKPTDLMEKLIILQEYLLKLTSTPTGGVVCDPFCGSGSTLVAAKRLGRPAIGIEQSPEYCDIAIERLKRTQRPIAQV